MIHSLHLRRILSHPETRAAYRETGVQGNRVPGSGSDTPLPTGAWARG